MLWYNFFIQLLTGWFNLPIINFSSLWTHGRSLSPGVVFTNILCADFMRADPKRAKSQSSQAAFSTFGSARIKAGHWPLILAILNSKQIKIFFFQVYVACSIHLFSLAKFWPEYDQVIVLIIVTLLILFNNWCLFMMSNDAKPYLCLVVLPWFMEVLVRSVFFNLLGFTAPFRN